MQLLPCHPRRFHAVDLVRAFLSLDASNARCHVLAWARGVALNERAYWQHANSVPEAQCYRDRTLVVQNGAKLEWSAANLRVPAVAEGDIISYAPAEMKKESTFTQYKGSLHFSSPRRGRRYHPAQYSVGGYAGNLLTPMLHVSQQQCDGSDCNAGP